MALKVSAKALDKPLESDASGLANQILSEEVSIDEEIEGKKPRTGSRQDKLCSKLRK